MNILTGFLQFARPPAAISVSRKAQEIRGRYNNVLPNVLQMYGE